MDGDAKRRRLLALGQISDAHVVKVAQVLRSLPDLDLASRKPIRTARSKLWDRIGAKSDINGTDFEHLSFSSVLKLMAGTEVWKQALLRLYSARPCTSDSPYSLVFYGDEITPGNVLAPEVSMKFMAWYATLSEFPFELVCHTSMWLPLAVMASNKARTLGGVSNVTRVLLRHMFLTERISDDGVVLELADRQFCFYFAIKMFLFDGEAYRAVWSCKASSGKRPCLKCDNVVNDKGLASRDPFLLDFSSHDVSKMVKATNAQIWANADRLKAKHADRILGRCTKAEFDKLSVATGFTFSESGLVWDVDLRRWVRPADQITFDSMHNLYSNGLCQFECSLLFGRLFSLGFEFDDFRTFINSRFNICRTLGLRSHLVGCASQKRQNHLKSSGTFVCNASEMLLLRPVLLHFLQRVLQIKFDIKKELASFEALSDMCMAAFSVKRTRSGQAHYQACAVQYCRLTKVAHGEDCTKAKHHFALHAENECSFDCFAGERKNQILKAVAQHNRRGARREFSILTRAVGCQLDELETCEAFRDRLHAHKESCPGILVSKHAFHQGSDLQKDDVIRASTGEILVIRGFLDVSPDVGWSCSGIVIVADVYLFHRVVTPHSASFALSSSSSLVQVRSFELVPVSYFDGPNFIVALS